MAERKRGTNGRYGKSGVYNPSHNDRNFDPKNAENIDPSRTHLNRYANYVDGSLQFAPSEEKYYYDNFTDHINEQNARNKATGHAGRETTMYAYLTSKNTCPEETIWEIGTKDDHIDGDTLWEIMHETMAWVKNITGSNLVILNEALHLDEATPHIHERHVWQAVDKYGCLIVSQTQALNEIAARQGWQLPHPDKKVGRYNNLKMTYTAIVREKFLSIANERGLDLEITPREPSKSGRDLLQYQVEQKQKELQETEAENKRLKDENDRMKTEKEANEHTIAQMSKTIEEQKTKLSKYAKYEVSVQSVDIEASPVSFSGGKYVKVEKTAYQNNIEMARAYAVNKDTIDNLKEIERVIRERDKKSVQREQAIALKEAELAKREEDATVTALRERLTARDGEISALRDENERKDKDIREMKKRAEEAENKVSILESLKRTFLEALAGIANALSKVDHPLIYAVVHFIDAVIHTNAPDAETTIYEEVDEPPYINKWLENHGYDDFIK